MKILILEDDRTTFQVLQLILRRAGHDVTVATAIEELPTDPRNVQVLDQDQNPASLDLWDIDAAFLDGNLLTDIVGVALAEPLKRCGAVTISTSANLDLVAQFKAAGVDYVREKGELLAFVKENLDEVLTLRQSRLASR